MIFALDFTRGERGDGNWCLCWVYVSCLDCVYVLVPLNTSRWMLSSLWTSCLDRFIMNYSKSHIHINTTSLACILGQKNDRCRLMSLIYFLYSRVGDGLALNYT